MRILYDGRRSAFCGLPCDSLHTYCTSLLDSLASGRPSSHRDYGILILGTRRSRAHLRTRQEVRCFLECNEDSLSLG